MSDLLDSFKSAHAALPEAPTTLQQSRQAAIDALMAMGLPGPRAEAWKYTSLRALARQRFLPAPTVQVDDQLQSLMADIPAPRCVFVNGRWNDRLSDLGDLANGLRLSSLAAGLAEGDAQALAALGRAVVDPAAVFGLVNDALASDGLLFSVAAGLKLATPVHLVSISDARSAAPSEGGRAPGYAWHLRHAIEVGAEARATLVQHELSIGETRTLATTVCDLRLAESASLTQLRRQELNAASAHFVRDQASLGSDSRYQRLDLELGAGLSRHELNVSLAADGASLQADGVLLGSASAQVDTRLGIVHAAPNTRCELTWRGLGRDKSRVAFHGGITIEAGADGSDAMLSNKNLLLSEQAEIDTQPVLVIHADEVKAAHGATVGRLDPTALFYLRSRGLPEGQARRLLTAAFCHELLLTIDHESLRALLSGRLDVALGREGEA